MREPRSALLGVVLAAPLALETVLLLLAAARWASEADTPLRVIFLAGLLAAAAVLGLACFALPRHWSGRILWVLVAVLCAGMAVSIAWIGDVDGKWQPSLQVVLLAYAVALAVVVLVRRPVAKLTSASS